MDSLPSRIGKFEVLSLIGRGAMGVVYKARDPYIGRLVALKRISLSDLIPEDQRAEFKERFFIEARAAGGLKHPNIVTIHDVDEAEGAPFMAMEFVEGGSLSKLMKERGALPVDEAVSIVRQVALGLAYAHERGVVHRDIKPDNILLDKGGRVVITDFGAAHLNSSELTRTGEVLGTPHYMSPEQILGDEVDGRSDLFSLGVVFFLLLTGRRPFKGDTISSVCYHIVHSPPEPVPDTLPLAERALPVLRKVLAKNREERYQTGLEFAEALNALEIEGESTAAGATGLLTETWDVATPTPGTQKAPLTPSQPLRAVQPPRPPAAPPPAPVQAAPPKAPPAVRPAPSAAPKPAPKPAPQHRKSSSKKGLWVALILGGGALFGLVVLIVVGFFVVRMMRRTSEAPPAPTPTEITGSASNEPAGPEATTDTGAPGPTGAQAPDAFKAATAEASQPAPTAAETPAPTPKKEPSPTVEKPKAPQPSPEIRAAVEEMERQLGEVAALASRRRFGKAFSTLDGTKKRLNDLKVSAAPADEPALRLAGEKLAKAEAQAQEVLATASRPVLEQGVADLAQVQGKGLDAPGIIAAYAEVYPVIRWKERLPEELRLSVEEFMRQCRARMSDQGWAKAHQVGQGMAFPGQS